MTALPDSLSTDPTTTTEWFTQDSQEETAAQPESIIRVPNVFILPELVSVT